MNIKELKQDQILSKYQKTNSNEIFPQVNNGNKVINASLDIKVSNQ